MTPGPNKDAIAVLEHVVGEDPGYAPAWEALGLRCYYDSYYGGGGEPDVPALECAAFERAHCAGSEPHGTGGEPFDRTNRVERGELGRAYDGGDGSGEDGVRRAQTPTSLSAMCCVMPGMQEKSTQECNTARAQDPGKFDNFRSCAWAFLQLGQSDRAMDFVHLDSGSRVGCVGNGLMFIWAAGNVGQARESAKIRGEGARLTTGN
jgi:hypothetical protein